MKESLHVQLAKAERMYEDMRQLYEDEHNRRLIAEGKLGVYEQVSLGPLVETSAHAISTITEAIAHVLADLKRRT